MPQQTIRLGGHRLGFVGADLSASFLLLRQLQGG